MTMNAMTEKERLLKTLFDDPKREHIDIKFCRLQIQRGVAVDRFCKEVNTALFMADKGLLTPIADAEPKQFDVADLK
jgi:hypothetical protein